MGVSFSVDTRAAQPPCELPRLREGRWSFDPDFKWNEDESDNERPLTIRKVHDQADLFKPYLPPNYEIVCIGVDNGIEPENPEECPWIYPRIYNESFVAYLDYYAFMKRKPILMSPTYFVFLLLQMTGGIPNVTKDGKFQHEKMSIMNNYKSIDDIVEDHKENVHISDHDMFPSRSLYNEFRAHLPDSRNEFPLALMVPFHSTKEDPSSVGLASVSEGQKSTAFVCVPLTEYYRVGSRKEWSEIFSWFKKHYVEFIARLIDYPGLMGFVQTMYDLLRLMNLSDWNTNLVRGRTIHIPRNIQQFVGNPHSSAAGSKYEFQVIGNVFREHSDFIEPCLHWAIITKNDNKVDPPCEQYL